MADQGKWWKLWCASLRDDDLENLSIHDWFGWARLGAHIKEHGKEGKLRLRAPATAVVNLLRVPDFEAAISMIKRFPNYTVGERNSTVSPETFSPVSIEIEVTNWWKYQGDFSSERVRRFRDKKRHSETVQEEKRRRGEEKRQEEKRIKVVFAKPSLAILTAFVQTENLKIDPQRFYNYYEANGWRVGRNPMKDWKAAARNWKQEGSYAGTSKPANAFVATGDESRKYDSRDK